MNKRQIEVQKLTIEEEAKVIGQLKQVYTQAKKDCEAKISTLASRRDLENIQSIVYQKQYQQALKKQIDGVLDTLQNNEFTTISDYVGTSYENGFFGTLYDLQGQGIPLCFPIDQAQVVQALEIDSKISTSLYKKLGEDTEYLKKSIKAEVSRGIASGLPYAAIATRIADGMNSPFNKAYNNSIRIARTEGHRVQQSAALDCQCKAKEKGADVKKQWDATLDSVTRPHHKDLDGQIREVEESFEVAGLEAMHPGAFGTASEDCNCRCCVLPYTEWKVPEAEFTKMNGDTNELVKIKAKDYNKFKETAKGYLTKMQFPSDIYKVNGVTKEVKEELESALLKLKSEYDIRLNSISVEKAGKRDIFVVGYHDGVMDMVVNADADFGRIIKMMDYNYRIGKFAGKSLEDYVTHEMFHIMAYQDCNTDAIYRARYNQIEGMYPQIHGVSRYADRSKSGNEQLAEAFVRMNNNEKVDSLTKILVETYVRKWKK